MGFVNATGVLVNSASLDAEDRLVGAQPARPSTNTCTKEGPAGTNTSTSSSNRTCRSVSPR